MRLLFCHDGPLSIDENNNYYGTAHNDDTFSRYFKIAEEITVAIRVSETTKKEAERKLSRITISPFSVVKCPNISSLKGKLFNKEKAKAIIKKEVLKADYVVVRLPSFLGFIALDFARKFERPYLVELVTCPWDALWNHSLKGKIIAPSLFLKTKKRIRDADFVVYVTNKFLQKRYPTKGKNINCSNVALNEFDNRILNERLKKIKNMKRDSKLIIGTAAAVDVRFKGQQYIIKALGKLAQQGITNIEYQLVGGGNKKYLESVAEKYQVTDQVKFLGAIPHAKIFDWLDTIDLYVQPSRQEGLPRALIEAMSRGLPAFGANTAGIPELLQHEYIFSNNRNNIKEICRIIRGFDQKVMKKCAIRNYHESRKYERNILEKKRESFFYEFSRGK